MKEPAILLIDDDRDMCDSLADVIRLETPYKVESTTAPEKALEMVREKRYALIVIDYKMPGMNGLELLKKIKAVDPRPVIFILTAFISNEIIEQARNDGAKKVLSKFIWPDEILANIKEAIE
jgi:two-component system nitrogen regulation response regulator GlnG